MAPLTLSQYLERLLPENNMTSHRLSGLVFWVLSRIWVRVSVVIPASWEQRLVQYLLRYRTRRHLRHLSAEQLADVGLTVEQAQDEMATPFWR